MNIEIETNIKDSINQKIWFYRIILKEWASEPTGPFLAQSRLRKKNIIILTYAFVQETEKI